ncbi:uncharacterized protein O3C94_020149 [Discoglossus pictus]
MGQKSRRSRTSRGDGDKVTPSVLSESDQEEETNMRSIPEIKEEEIPVDISDETLDVKPPVVAKVEQEELTIRDQQQVKEEESPGNIREDDRRQNTSGQHYITTTELHQTISVEYNNNGLKSQRCNQQKSQKGKEESSECGKYFVNTTSLLKHQRVPKRNKPFACSKCEKRFTQKCHLIRHKNLHKGDKPFACFECEKRFTQKCHLIRHKNLHRGDKPFACSESYPTY